MSNFISQFTKKSPLQCALQTFLFVLQWNLSQYYEGWKIDYRGKINNFHYTVQIFIFFKNWMTNTLKISLENMFEIMDFDCVNCIKYTKCFT